MIFSFVLVINQGEKDIVTHVFFNVYDIKIMVQQVELPIWKLKKIYFFPSIVDATMFEGHQYSPRRSTMFSP
jgi:hypothetical protein